MKSQQSSSQSKAEQLTPAQLAGGLIISVGEARKLLGADAKELSDDEIVALIYELSEIAQTLLNTALSSNERLL